MTEKVTLMNRSDMSFTIVGEGYYPNRSFDGYGVELTIPYEELRDIANTRGGRNALKNFLMIKGTEEEVTEILTSLSIFVESEYYYKADTIKAILKKGSLDLLEDTLNFAPQGVIDLLQTIAIQMPLTDMNKIEMISEHLGINLITMINNGKKQKELSEKKPEKIRKVDPAKKSQELEQVEEKAKSKPGRKRKSEEKIDTTNETDEL